MKPYSFKSMRSRLMFWFYLIAAAVLLVSLTLTYLRQVQTIRQDSQIKLVTIRDLTRRQIENWFSERKGDLFTIVESFDLIKLHRGIEDNDAQNANLQKFDAARNLMQNYLQNYKDYEEIFIIDVKTGKIIISTDRQMEGISKKDDPYLLQPVKSGSFYIKNVYYSHKLSKPVLAFALPVINPQNKDIIAVLVARITLEGSIYNILENHLGLGESGESLIINEQRQTLSRLRWMEHDPLHFVIDAMPAAESATGKTGVVRAKDYRGVEVLAAYTYLPVFQWGLVVKQDVAELLRPIRMILFNYLLIFFVTYLAIIIIVNFIAHNIARPIAKLREFSSRIEQEDFSARIQIDSRDEFKILAQTFNLLATVAGTSITVQKKVNELSRKIIPAQTRKEFAAIVINSLMDITNSIIGAFYIWREDDNLFHHIYSAGASHDLWKSFDGNNLEGELGLAIQSRRIYRISDIPDDTKFKFKSIAGEAVIKEIVCIPVIVGGKVKAVITGGSLHKFSDLQMDVINRSWININSTYSRLLANEKTRHLAEELQNKNEKLQSQAEELQSQTEELQEQTEELQSQSEELQEQNTELEVQRKQVEEANRLKSEFLSNMSHELRTPLNSVLALTHMLIQQAKDRLTDEQIGYLQIVERSGKNLHRLIDEILDLSKIEAGKINFVITEFSLTGLLKEIAESLQPLAKNKDLTLKLDSSANLPAIQSDKTKLHQVFTNVIGNAIKFTNEGRIEVKAESNETEIQVKVIDTGIGIAENDQKSIFEEFRQLDGSTSRSYEGTGLGLAIAKKMLNLLGGSISVESKVGVGSTFTIALPIKTDLQGEVIEQFLPASREYDPQKTRLLIVEDNPTTVMQIKSFLSEAGFQVDVASSGKAALEFVSRQIPDGIILDLMMPEVDGFQVLEKIRSTTATKKIPVLILTAKDLTESDLKKLSANNIQQLIQKGHVNKQGLLQKIHKMMGWPLPEEKRMSENEKPLVLIVEDNVDNLTAINAVLQNKYRILQAVDGEQGLRKAVAEKPDVILLDMSLPKMDGTEIASILKNSDDTKHIRIIAVTARVMPADKEYFLQEGCDDFVPKPIEEKTLIRAIEKQLRKKR